MSWFTKLFGLQSPSDTTAKSTPTRNAQQAQRQTQPTAQKAPSPAVNKTVTAAPTAAPKRTTRSEDDELRNAVAKIEASVKERNDPEFPILTLSVHRQSEDTAPVMICLPEDRKNVPTEEDVCIIWLYPYDKGLGYADAEELLRSHLKPLDYKLAEPRTKYSDGKKSYHHWIAKKVPVEPEPPTLEAKAVLEGHTSYVNCVCYSPDGKMIASGAGLYGDSDNTVRLWDADTGKQRTSLKGRTDRVVDIAYTPDGKLLASVGSSICLWNISSEQPVWQLEMPQGYRGPIRGNCVCFSPDGKMMACGCSDASVRLWDVESGSHIREMQGHRRGLDSVAFSPNGRFLASGSADGTVRIWEASTGREVHTLQGNSACYSPDGSAVASASPDRIVRIWDTESGKQLKSLEGHDAEVTCVCYSPDGKALASGSKDKTIRIWDAETGKQLYALKGHTNDVRAVNFSPDGVMIASASADKSVRLWMLAKDGAGEKRAMDSKASESATAPMTGQLKGIIDHIARGDATAVAEFSAAQEANALAQAKIDLSWSADEANGVKTVLLKALSSNPTRAFLLVNMGSRQLLCSKYEAFNKKGLLKRLIDSLPEEEAKAIQPVTSHENFSLPGMDLLPGDHLKPFAEAIKRNEYEVLAVDPPEKTKIVVASWKEEQEREKKAVTDVEGLFAKALAAAEGEARKDRSVSVRKVFISQQLGEAVISWSTPDDGSDFNSDRARELLAKHLQPLGVDLKGSFVGGDPQDSRSYCYFYMYKKSGEK